MVYGNDITGNLANLQEHEMKYSLLLRDWSWEPDITPTVASLWGQMVSHFFISLQVHTSTYGRYCSFLPTHSPSFLTKRTSVWWGWSKPITTIYGLLSQPPLHLTVTMYIQANEAEEDCWGLQKSSYFSWQRSKTLLGPTFLFLPFGCDSQSSSSHHGTMRKRPKESQRGLSPLDITECLNQHSPTSEHYV